MSRKLRKKSGFSLLEVIAAVVILAVVATATIATISPMRAKSQKKIDEQNIAKLNSIVQAYYIEKGAWPTAAMTQLWDSGYLELDASGQKRYPTPTNGVYYRFDTTTRKVINPSPIP
jgi:prepilin-type N-terminal cleavage/methylation domain-containing protein